MVNQEKKVMSTFEFAPIVKGALAGFAVVLLAVLIGSILMLNKVVSLNYFVHTALISASIGFFTAAFVSAASAKTKKLISGMLSCVIMIGLFWLFGIALPNTIFSMEHMSYIAISAAIFSVLGSMFATMTKRR